MFSVSLDKNMKPMPKIEFTKKLDGLLYIVEAVGENKNKILRIITAYIKTAL